MSAVIEPYTVGTLVELEADLSNLLGTATEAAAVTWLVTDPAGQEHDLSGSVTNPGTGVYKLDVTPDAVGIWRWRIVTDGLVVAAEGTFEARTIYLGGVTDRRDLRVLIPACRRAVDGPAASTPDSPSTTLGDTEIVGLLADATAELILSTASADGSTGNAFGNRLVVTSRDSYYLAPNGWATQVERSTAQDAAILSQAALNYYFQQIKLLKVTEDMKNEAVEWSYSLSANVIAGWMQYLIGNRDRAVAALQAINVPLDSYISMVAERDRLAAAWLEPWVAEIGAPVPYAGGGGSGPLEFDYRFNTWG